MLISFRDISVYYTRSGNGDDVVLFLHGWGGTSESFSPFEKKLEKNHTLISLDFPPFGKSEEPYEVWTLSDYQTLVENILEKENVNNFSIVAHSFGGRIAIMLAASFPERVKKLVLIGCAGLKKRLSFKTCVKILFYKFEKKIRRTTKREWGSEDWKTLSPLMKQTFNNIILSNLKNEAKKIKAKTLIVYGSIDTETPPYLQKKLSRLVKNSTLLEMKGYSHFVHFENYYEFSRIMKNFLEKN